MLAILIKRNVKLFFKDKGMFFTSLITPVILLVLYATASRPISDLLLCDIFSRQSPGKYTHSR